MLDLMYGLVALVATGWMIPVTAFLLLLPARRAERSDHRNGDRAGNPAYA